MQFESLDIPSSSSFSSLTLGLQDPAWPSRSVRTESEAAPRSPAFGGVDQTSGQVWLGILGWAGTLLQLTGRGRRRGPRLPWNTIEKSGPRQAPASLETVSLAMSAPELN